MRKVALIQARMGSSRLPGKVLREINGRPMLAWVVRRAQRAALVDSVVVATSAAPADDAIAAWAQAENLPLFRGDLYDVLDRLYGAARAQEADLVIRITADCPLIDPALIDRTVRGLLGVRQPQDRIVSRRGADSLLPPVGLPFDFAANRLPPPWKRTYPIGLDVEVCTFSALETAWKLADQPYEREHVMPYLYQREGMANVLLLNAEADYGARRWTVDTAADLALVRRIFAHFDGQDDFSWRDVLAFLQEHPELEQINAHIGHKTLFDVDERLVTNTSHPLEG